MDITDGFPSYVSKVDVYRKLYCSLRYTEPDVVQILRLFKLESPKNEVYFNCPVNMARFEYILRCMISMVTEECGAATGSEEQKCKANTLEDVAGKICKFSRGQITRAIQFLQPQNKRYSLLYLVHTAATHQPPSLTEKELLHMIATCPSGYVFSMDLMIYITVHMPRTFTGLIPVVSNSELAFEYVHHVLFGCNSKSVNAFLNNIQKEKFLCIDTGKAVGSAKGYSNVDEVCKIVSSSPTIFLCAQMVVREYVSANTFILAAENGRDGRDDKVADPAKDTQNGKEAAKKVRRKTIPKAIKNQLWKSHFGDRMKGKCYCCKGEIDALCGWEAGHIQAAAKGGSDNIDNLRPVCSTCNKSMSSMNMDDYIHTYHSKACRA